MQAIVSLHLRASHQHPKPSRHSQKGLTSSFTRPYTRYLHRAPAARSRHRSTIVKSGAGDLGALADRTGVRYLLLTHLIPAIGTEAHGPFVIPGGPLSPGDFESAARAGGFDGEIRVGKELLTVRLTENQ